MMSAVLLVLQLLFASVQIPDTNPWTISVDGGSGAITAATTETDLQRMYGLENVKNGEIQIGEGEVESGTVVFPDDPLKRIELLWADPEKRVLKSVYLSGIHNSAYGDKSLWRTTYGITLGTTLLELERINRKPFWLAGFDWDYSGTVLSWNNGVLEGVFGSEGRKKVFLRLGYSTDPAPPERLAVQGDHDFSSGHPAMQKINPHVYQIVFMFHPRS
jgi:hypothetical protein